MQPTNIPLEAVYAEAKRFADGAYNYIKRQRSKRSRILSRIKEIPKIVRQTNQL